MVGWHHDWMNCRGHSSDSVSGGQGKPGMHFVPGIAKVGQGSQWMKNIIHIKISKDQINYERIISCSCAHLLISLFLGKKKTELRISFHT